MYGFPADLDLSSALGQETTQFCVGPYDLQFSFGIVAFAIQSRVEIIRASEVIASWEAGQWPSPEFYQLFNTPVTAIRLMGERRLALALAGDLEIHLLDTSDRYESMQIYVGDNNGPYIV